MFKISHGVIVSDRPCNVYTINLKQKIRICPYRCSMFLFVCFSFFVPFENFSLIWKHHHCRWRPANFNLNKYDSLACLLWHWTSVYNGHSRGPGPLRSIAKRLAGLGELSLPGFYNLRLSRLGFEHPNFCMRC